MTIGADGLDYPRGRTFRIRVLEDMVELVYTRGMAENSVSCGHGIALLTTALGHRLEALCDNLSTPRVNILVYEAGRSIHDILDRVLTDQGL